MVDLFFVLSGYVIYANYGTRLHNLKDICRFQFLRVGRLYPVHLTVLAAFFVAEIAKSIAQSRFGLQFGLPPFAHFTPANTLANLTLTQALGLNAGLVSINGPSWSISTELYTYLLFALITAYLSLYRVTIYIGTAAIALVLLACANTAFLDLHSDLLRCLTGFFLGCLVAVYSAKISHKKLPAIYRESAIVLFLAFLCLKQEQGSLLALAIYPLSAVLIFTTLHSGNGLGKKLLLSTPVITLGALSYSLYMWHYLIIWSVDNLTPHLASRLPTSGVLHAGQYAAVIVITLLVSYFSYRFIEQAWRMKARAKAAVWFDRSLSPKPSIIL